MRSSASCYREARVNSATSVGRVTGILVLAHLVAGLMAPFILLDRVRGSASLLANAAAQPGTLRAAVFLLFVGSALAVGIAIEAYPVFRRSSVRMAMWLIALGVAGFSLQAVDNASLLTLSTLSRESATASPARAMKKRLQKLRRDAVYAGRGGFMDEILLFLPENVNCYLKTLSISLEYFLSGITQRSRVMKKSTGRLAPAIVLVDDEPEILFSSTVMLRRAGFFRADRQRSVERRGRYPRAR